jgi:hypothetical protein
MSVMSRDDSKYDDGRQDRDRGYDSDDVLKIRTRGSRVVRVQEWDDGRWKREDLHRDERYYLQDGQLVHEERNRVRYYEDTNGDGIWRRTTRTGVNSLIADSTNDPVISGGTAVATANSYESWDDRDDGWEHRSGYGEDAHRFDLVNGQVTNLQEFDDGRWKNERIDYDETWTFDGTNLVKTERERYGNEISTFTDNDSDGIFTRVSEIYAAF